MVELVPTEAINDRLNTVNLVMQQDGSFVIDTVPPRWLTSFNQAITTGKPFRLEETFLFFDSYLQEARESLAEDGSGVIHSGPWSEHDKDGTEQNLSALSFLVDNRVVVQLRLIDESQLYHQAIFQKAREYSMSYERLQAEREHKEVLLHTIVHDLAGPLTSISGALYLLSKTDADEELVQLALEQCDIEKSMIALILETFSAELSRFDPQKVTRDSAPDLLQQLRSAQASYSPVFASQNVSLTLDVPDSLEELAVVAEASLLNRVMSNLLGNAVRYSPRGTTTTIRIDVSSDVVRVHVTDQGPGVPAEMQGQIFERFVGGRGYGGQSGIGLYFCRITVEKWGGRVGFDKGPDDTGADVWFELSLAR